MRNLVPRSPRPRLIRPGEREFEAKPVQLTCPGCAEDLGAIVLMDPRWRMIQVEIQCPSVDGVPDHRELHIKTLDLAKKEELADAAPAPVPTASPS